MDLLVFSILQLLGVMTPGPDFAIVSKYGLSGSRKAALLASFGIMLALFIHVFYCVSGVALFLNASPRIQIIIQVLGSVYLGYLGVMIFLQENSEEKERESRPLVKYALMAGFLTNLLNPKATVFLLSLFSRFAPAMDSLGMKITFGILVPLIAVLWFSTLSCFLTHPYFLPFLQKNRNKFMRIMAVILLFLSISGLISVIL